MMRTLKKFFINNNTKKGLDCASTTGVIIVSPFSRLKPVIKQYRPSHMITLLSPNAQVWRDKAITLENHHILFFNDINEPRPNLIAPQMYDVETIISFAKNWKFAKDTQPLLIHCQMGISRSTAAAYIIACALNESLNEEALAIRLRELSPSATPNARLIALADDYLDRNGNMITAIKRIGRGAEASEGMPFILSFEN